jgi:hypothetical protein
MESGAMAGMLRQKMAGLGRDIEQDWDETEGRQPIGDADI